MIKYKLFFLSLCLLVLSTASISAKGADQVQYVFFAELHNVCGYLIRVSAWDFSSTLPVDKGLEINDKIVVLTLNALTDNINDLEKDSVSYGLSVISKWHGRFINWEKFVNVLKKSEKTQDGNTIILTIKDPSICPGN